MQNISVINPVIKSLMTKNTTGLKQLHGELICNYLKSYCLFINNKGSHDCYSPANAVMVKTLSSSAKYYYLPCQ